MAGSDLSKKGFSMFVADRQRPIERNQAAFLEIQGVAPNNTERTFVQQKIKRPTYCVTTQDPPKPTAKPRAPGATSYARFRWIDSDAGGEAGQQIFHPPKRRRLEKSPSQQKLRLNGKSPLKTGAAVSEDIWRIIFSSCEPKLLLTLRYVCITFREILKESGIWRESREAFFGRIMPKCPFFLSEMQYVDLLVGSGCQSSWCLRRGTRNANWIFRGRLCEDCLRQKTSTDVALGELQSANPCPELLINSDQIGIHELSYLDLIPTAYHDSGKYYAPRRIDSNTGQWYGTSHRSQGLLYLKSDYRKLIEEFDVIRQESWELRRILDWAKARYDNALRYGKVAHEMFHFELSISPLRWGYVSARTQAEREREVFFTRKAGELEDPMEPDLLPFFAAYQAALLTCNKASERAWQLLLPKILPYREEAQRVKQYQLAQPQCHVRNKESEWSADARLFKKLHDHRHVTHVETGQWTPEQTFVRNLGREELTRLNGDVADADLVLMCLRNVYDRFQESENKPRGMKFDGVEDTYQLSLDDARMIVEDIIQPEMDRKTMRSVAVLRSFKCPGCIRSDAARKYTFRSCLEHIRATHSTKVGKGLEFSRFARNSVSTSLDYSSGTYPRSSSESAFPWYIVAWTRTLPVLPLHANVTKDTRWEPDSDAAYAPQKVRDANTGPSIFDGRAAIPREGAEQADLQVNFLYAISTFEPTQLDTASVVKIALTYALSLGEQISGDIGPKALSREELVDHLKAARTANPTLTFKFQCGLCSHQPEADKHTRCARTAVDLTRLHNHWLQKHKDAGPDAEDALIDLPSGVDLMLTMQKHDQNLRDMQSQSIERETIGLKKTYRKKPDYKATILMSKPMCLDIFNTLFQHTSIEHNRDALERSGEM